MKKNTSNSGTKIAFGKRKPGKAVKRKNKRSGGGKNYKGQGK